MTRVCVASGSLKLELQPISLFDSETLKDFRNEYENVVIESTAY